MKRNLEATLLALAPALGAAQHPWWILGSAAVVLHGADPKEVWDVDVLLDQRDLVVARPDANAVTAAMSLIAGSEQTLTTAAVALIDIPRNSAGNKRAIRKVEVEHLDAINRDWRSMTGVTEIAHFIFDDRDPRTFEVYPPAAASGASVEVIYGAYPTDVSAPGGDGKAYTTVSGNISVKDQWATALLNYMLSRAYSKDTEAGGNVQLALPAFF